MRVLLPATVAHVFLLHERVGARDRMERDKTDTFRRRVKDLLGVGCGQTGRGGDCCGGGDRWATGVLRWCGVDFWKADQEINCLLSVTDE